MPTKTKKTRKHQGIIQSGGNKGKLKKGYKYSGKKLKSGLPQILKVTKKKNKSQKKNKIQRGGYSKSFVEYNDNLTEFLNNNVPPPTIGGWIFSPSHNIGGPQTIVYKNEYYNVHITFIDKKSQRTGNILPYTKLHNNYKEILSFNIVNYNEKFNNNTIWDIHAMQQGISNIDGREYKYHVYGVNNFDDNHPNGTFVYTAQDYRKWNKWNEIANGDYSSIIEALIDFIKELKNLQRRIQTNENKSKF